MLRALFALAAGAAYALAFAPYGMHPVAILALAVLFELWRDATPRQAAWRGWWFGLGMFGHGAWWVQVSIHQFGLPLYTFSVTMTVLFILFIAALFVASVGYAVARVPVRQPPARVFIVMPALWVVGEWLRSVLLTGFPWLLAGYSQTDSWFAGYVPIVGVLGTGGVLALIAASLVMGARHPGPAVALTVALASGGVALGQLSWTLPEAPAQAVALVQGAVPQAIKWRAEFRARTLELYEALTAPAWGSALVLWPETAVPAFPDEITEALAKLGANAEAHGTALLVGIPSGERRGGPYFNSVMLLNAPGQRYDKHHLVPFGEYLPFDTVVRPVLDFLSIPMSDFTPGADRQPPLRHRALRIGVSICYEDAYASEVIKPLPEANVLVNVSDDSWFGDTVAPHQHLQISRARALEAGRYMLRATNTGISAIIDPRGRVLSQSPQFEPYVLRGEVVPHTGATPFVRLGHGPVLGVCVFTVLAAVVMERRRRVRFGELP